MEIISNVPESSEALLNNEPFRFKLHGKEYCIPILSMRDVDKLIDKLDDSVRKLILKSASAEEITSYFSEIAKSGTTSKVDLSALKKKSYHFVKVIKSILTIERSKKDKSGQVYFQYLPVNIFQKITCIMRFNYQRLWTPTHWSFSFTNWLYRANSLNDLTKLITLLYTYSTEKKKEWIRLHLEGIGSLTKLHEATKTDTQNSSELESTQDSPSVGGMIEAFQAAYAPFTST